MKLSKKKKSSMNTSKTSLPTKPNPRNLLERLTKDVENKGVVFFEPKKNLDIDEEYLSLPHDLTECDGAELGRYLNAFTQHRMYMRTIVGWQGVVVEEKKRSYLEHSSPHYSDLTANRNLSETAKDKLINLQEDVYPYYLEYSDEKEKLGLMESVLNSIEDGIFLISREISRRNHDWDTETRNDNVQRARKR